MNRGGSSMPLRTPRRRGIPLPKTCKSRNLSTDGRESCYLLTFDYGPSGMTLGSDKSLREIAPTRGGASRRH